MKIASKIDRSQMQNGRFHVQSFCEGKMWLQGSHDILRCVDLNSGVSDIAQSIVDVQGSLSLKVLKLPVWSPHGGSLARDGWVCCSQTLILLLPAAGSVVFRQAAKLCFT